MTLLPSFARRLKEYDDRIAKLIVLEYEKHDGRTYEQIIHDVTEETREEFIQLVRLLNGIQVSEEPS